MSRREKKPIDAGPGWLATYGDLVTLLFAFFVMLFAISSVESDKFEAFLSGLGHFENTSATPGVFPAGIDSAQFVVTPAISAGFRSENVAGVEAELQSIEEQIIDAAEEAGVLGSLNFRRDERGIAAAIATDQVLFQSGSAELTPTGRTLLDGIGQVLVRLPYDVTVEGHSDSVPLSRGAYTNWNLSTDRAVSVLQHFIAGGMEAKRFAAAGYADQRPVDPADTADARSKNRRVEIVIHARPVPQTATSAATGLASDTPDAAQPPPLPPVDLMNPSSLRTAPVELPTGP